MHSKEKKNEQLTTREEVSNMCLGKMLFPSSWWFPSPHCPQRAPCLPTTSAVCHSGLSLLDHVLLPRWDQQCFSRKQQERTFLFTLKCTVPLHSSVSPFYHSGPLNTCAATYFSDMLEGSHTLCSGSYPQVFSKCSAHLMCLQPTPSFWHVSHADLLFAFGHVLGRGLDHRSQVK